MANRQAVVAAPPPLDIQSSNSHHKHTCEWIVISLLTVSICAMFYICFRWKLYTKLFQSWKKKGNLDMQEIKLKRFRLDELEKATNNFSQDCLVGSGGFGNVYRGKFDADETLAIKKALADSYSSTEEFRNEVRLLSKVKHENLVSLVGFCDEAGQGAQILVYEYVANGSLLDYIIGRGGKNLTWRQRVNVAIGAAKGIAHLHEGIMPSIIHRDIKPSNILIGEGFEAKVSDFGLVKSGPVGDQSHVSSQIKGTPGYLDPAYCSSFHLTPFSDVYSFGVILLQLIAARPAVDTTGSHSKYHIIDWARPSLERGNVEEILDANLLLGPCNTEMMLKMGQLGLRCVAKVPKERPKMTEVWQELEAALYSTGNFMVKQPSKGSWRSTGMPSRSTDSRSHRSTNNDSSFNSVSVDGIRLQRFHPEMDSLSFVSTSLRCLDINRVSIETGENSLRSDMCEFDYDDFSIPCD